MLTSVVIVTSKEHWLDFLPDTPISESEAEWGLREARLSYPLKPDPSIKEVVWKIRNAIAHSDFSVKVGRNGTPWKVLLKETTFIFKDSRGREPFEFEISMSDLSNLTAMIYITIQKHIEKYEVKKRGASERV